MKLPEEYLKNLIKETLVKEMSSVDKRMNFFRNKYAREPWEGFHQDSSIMLSKVIKVMSSEMKNNIYSKLLHRYAFAKDFSSIEELIEEIKLIGFNEQDILEDIVGFMSEEQFKQIIFHIKKNAKI